MTRFLVVLLLAAGAFTSSALAAPQTVSILDTGYIPDSVTVDRGDIVTWVNNGADLHTVTSDEGTTMESGQMERGGVFATVFKRPGRYPYHDDLNPDLRGVVIVRGTAAPASTTLAQAAGDQDGDGDRGAVLLVAVLAVAAAAVVAVFWIARRRRAGTSEP